MTAQPSIILYTQDADLRRRVEGYLKLSTGVRTADALAGVERLLRQSGPSVLLLDLRSSGAREFMAAETKRASSHLIIAFGVPRSDPMLEAVALGVYATEDVGFDGRHMQSLLKRAADHLRVAQENQMLRQEAERVSLTAEPVSDGRSERMDSPLPLRHFARAFRHFQDMDVMLERIVEGFASTASVSRAGIFVRTRENATYRFRFGLRCLEDTKHLEYQGDDELVKWLEIHAHLVCRSHLEQNSDPADRKMLKRALDGLGAEVLIPLHARGGMIGWLFVGHRATGRPFNYTDLEDMTIAAEHVSTNLENALLYSEVTLQKTLAETLLHALPTGIVAVDAQGIIRWFSTSAQNILMVPGERVVNQPVEALGSRMANVIRRTLNGETRDVPQAWTDTHTKRSVYVQTRQLTDRDACLGAVAMIQDMSAQRAMEEKQEQLERASFWNELAASMSHEIRNPLVAIKTFAQLLPERFNDEEFRDDFSKLVTIEVDRLNSIINQINDFAHPPALQMHALDIRKPLDQSLEEVLPPHARNGVRVDTAYDADLPAVFGDEHALADAFSHLLRNSLEALDHRPDGQILIDAHKHKNGQSKQGIKVTIRDNGPGIPSAILDKVFSPFCTTKARGMGLGLPIVKRTVIDHDGQVDVESNAKGTSVVITLPTSKAE